MLIRSAVSNIGLNNSPLPLADIQSPEVARALNKAAEPLQWLTETDQKWLSRFMSGDKVATGQMDDLAKDLPSIIRLFDNQLVLSYMNGSVWYQVPQLVRDHV